MTTGRRCSYLTIEPMRIDDLQEVAGIEIRSFATPWPLTAYLHELESNPNACYFVARCRVEGDGEDGDATLAHTLVGYAGQWMLSEQAHISTIAVHPSWRGNRIGEALLIRLIDSALRRRQRCITLEVRSSNSVAQRLYAKYGFVQTGIRRSYYPDNREDALKMSTPSLGDPDWKRQYANRRAELEDQAPWILV